MRLSKKTKTALLIVLLVACTVILTGLLGFITNGFTESNPENWELYSVNENNLIKLEDYTVKSHNSGEGYQVNIDEYGQIKLSGKNENTSTSTFSVCAITLPAGKYAFTSGANGTSVQGYNIALYNSVANNTIYADFTDSFTIAEETTFSLIVNVGADKTCNVTFSPVLVPGEKSQNFFTVGSSK